MEKCRKNLVGLMTTNSPDQLIGLLGILKSGNGFVPIDPDYPAERIEFMVRDCGIEILITEATHLDKVISISGGELQLKHIICLGGAGKPVSTNNGIRVYDASDFQGNGQSTQNDVAAPGQAAYLVYTSGSTGKPKGVPINHENLLHLLQWSKHYFKFGEHTRSLQSLSYCFDFGIFEILTSVIFGGTLYFIDKHQRMDPSRYAEAIEHHAINTINTTPSFCNELTCRNGELKTLEVLHLGGEALSGSAADKLFAKVGESCVIYNGYGPTETTINSSIFELGTILDRQRVESATVPIGKASAKNALHILDRNCNLVAEGVPGELHIGGPGVAQGYLDLPELTAQRFTPSAFSKQPGARLYRTGDVVRRLADGNIEFLGRVDHQVKVRGFRIELGEIEAALRRHPSVREAVVLARQDSQGSNRLVAYIVPDPCHNPTGSQMRAFLRQGLPDYMIPSAFVMLESLPLTPNGKLDRRALPSSSVADRAVVGNDFVAPRNLSEELVAEICAEVLGLERVGINDNFFDLGCHSLLATKIVLRLREVFNAKLPLVSLFENPTVAGLAERLQTVGQDDPDIPPIQAMPRDGLIPLSFSQERLWFLSQLDPTNVSYHVPRAVRIDGPFSVVVFGQAFSEIIRRHEILRTSFPTIVGKPVQVIHKPSDIEILVYDFRLLSNTEQEYRIHQQIVAEGRRSFDLARDSLIRLSVAQLGETRHVFILTEHHLVHDGWTQGVLASDFLALYRSMSEGVPAWQPEPAIQYADFACWQRQWLQGEVLEKQLSYWRDHLAGAPPVLDLPSDRPRPAVQSFRGAEHTLIIKAELAESLRSASRREGVTLFMTMLAAFKTMLYRYTGQVDVVVGSGVANRRARDTEGLLGMLINTIVLRTDLSGNPSFRELLKRVREVCLGSYAHQDLPFERLVEELRPERSLNYNPLFQVIFAFQDTATPELQLPGMTLELMDAHNQSAKFDLSFVVLPRREQLVGEEDANVTSEITVLIEYSTDLFDKETIARLASHYETLLHSVVRDQDRSISEMDMLSEEESRELLVDWNDTRIEYPPGNCAHALFEEQVKRAPESVAVTCEGVQLSYRELDRRANQLAHHLAAMGVGPEVPVALCVDRCPEMVIGLLAALKAGGFYVPMDPNYPADRLSYMLEDLLASGEASKAVLLTVSRISEKLPKVCEKSIELDRAWETIDSCPDTNPVVEISEDNLAYLIYTSGSTGVPKGVALTHAGLSNLTLAQQEIFGPLAGATVLQFSSLCFDASTWEVMMALSAGARLVLGARESVLAGKELNELIAREQVDVATIPPSVLAVVPQLEIGLGTLVVAGEACPEGLVQQWAGGRRMFDAYGPTETTVCATISGRLDENERPTIGRPITNTRAFVMDKRERLTPVGVPGELYVGGVGLARSYWRRAELTAERFVPDGISGAEGERLYRTGDQVRWNRSGDLEYLGRQDEQVKLRGYRIELAEIELMLMQHKGVRQCAVCVKEDEHRNNRLIAYIVASNDVAPSARGLRMYLLEKLPEYMVPGIFVELVELPLTSSGKLNRKALPAPVAPEQASATIDPRTPLEEIIASIWADVLRLEQVGVEENFFELGGHSLLAMQVISRVRETFQVEIALRPLFEQPTVSGLAAAVERQLGKESGAAVKIQPVSKGEELPLSFAQQRLWFIQKLEPCSAAYNIPVAVRVRGELAVFLLHQSLQEIARRHEILRTRLESHDGRPVQMLDEPCEKEFGFIDISSFDEADREQRAWSIASHEAGRPFDLERGPVWRVTLIRLSAEEHLLLLCLHHVAADGWSADVLLSEFTALHEAFQRGSQSPLAELPIQYSDFAVWQRQWLCGDALESQMEYWRQQLSEVPALDLPTDGPRPAVATRNSARERVTLPASLTRKLKELSRRAEVTLFMTLLSGFQLLLARYAGQDDIAIGSPIAGRNRAQTEGLIGFFVNMLVMRTDLTGDPTVKELLRRVREVCLSAYGHQEIPFEHLVKELRPARDLTRNPFFQVMFALQKAPQERFSIGDLTVEHINIVKPASPFDLSLQVLDGGSELNMVIEYTSSMYETGTIKRMLSHLENVLEWMTDHEEMRLSDLCLLNSAELHEILVNSNDTAVEYGPAICLHELISEQSKRSPESIAVVYDDLHLSYRELNRCADNLSHYLETLGVVAESKVGVCLDRSMNMAVALLGVLKAGAAYLPLDPGLPRDRLEYMIADAGADLIISEQRLHNLVGGLARHVLSIDTILPSLQESEESARRALPDSSAYVIYTSGSTGEPKGVVNTHTGIVNRLKWMQEAFHLTPEDVVLQKTPFSFDVSLWEFFWPLIAGARLAVAAPDGHKDPSYLVNIIREQQVSTIHFVPSMLQVFIEQPSLQKCTSLKRMICSGEALSAELEQAVFSRLDIELHNLYGPTEAAVDVSWYACHTGVRSRTVPIGRPIANLQLYLLDRCGHSVPKGVAGELFIAGEGLARGYLGQAELTAERFVPNPFSSRPCARMYRTGDLARYLSDCNIEFLGRMDHQVKIRGFRIELGEIESVISQHPQISEAVVEAHSYDREDKRLVAYLVSHEEQALAISGLREYLKTRLPEFMIPSAYVWIDKLPVTSNGKLDRRALPGPKDSSIEKQKAYVAPRDPVEELLAEMWSQVLGIDRIGIHDNFFDMGGHSLLLTRVAARIRNAFSVEMPLSTLFNTATIGELAVAITAEQINVADASDVSEMLEEIKQLSPHEIRMLLENGHSGGFAREDL